MITDGIHKCLTRKEYESIQAVNQSVLKLFKKTPAHARETMLHPPKPTEAMNFGSALHCAVLEPERFKSDYIIAPDWPRRSNADKQRWLEWEQANRGKEYLDQSEMNTIQSMVASCYDDEVITQLLTGKGISEVAVVWTDKETGTRCKALLDRVTTFAGYTVVIDLKSCQDASESEFALAIVRHGYHEQAAFYLAGLSALANIDRRFLFVAVEKSAPYGAAVYELDDESLKQGQIAYRKHLKMFTECTKTGIWPSYPSGIVPIKLPSWAMEMEFADAV